MAEHFLLENHNDVRQNIGNRNVVAFIAGLFLSRAVCQ